MPEMYLRQLELKYSTGRAFSKNKEQVQKLKKPKKSRRFKIYLSKQTR